jgi:ribose transport system substrate-binding protein
MEKQSRSPFHTFRKLALSLLLIMISAGCTSAPVHIQPSTDSNTTTRATSPRPTFGIIYPMAHSFYENVTENAEQAAKLLDVELIVRAPDEINVEQQIRIIETLIRQNVDGIAIVPIDSDVLAPYIDKAIEAGIPVICFESDSPRSKRLAYIGADNVQSGIRIGEAIDQLLKGKGMLLVETGTNKMKSLNERLEGFLSYIHSQTEIEVLEVRYNEGNEEQALMELERMIDDHPHFDAFVALDYISGVSSVLVWKAKGLNRYALTLGLMPEIEEAIRNGQIEVAVSQNEEVWGKQIVNHLHKAYLGEVIPAFVDTGITLTKR